MRYSFLYKRPRYQHTPAAGAQAAASAAPAGASLAWLLMSIPGGALAALVVAGIVAGRIGVPISGALLLGAAGIGALGHAAALARSPVALRPAELAATTLGALATAGVALALAWPSLLPLGISVDAVHHFQMVDWIAGHRALPPLNDDTRGLLGEMSAYPPGFALLVIALARASGLPALEAMYPAAALLGGLVAGMAVLLAAQAAPDAGARRSAAAEAARALALLIGPLLLLTHRTFSLEALIDHSYYTMVFGVFLTLLAIGHATPAADWTPGAAARFGLALAALVATYPLWAPLPAALAALVLYRQRRTAPLADARPWLAFSPALALALLDLPERIGAGQAVLAHQGLVATPTAERLVPLLLALPGAALLLASRKGCGLVRAAALAAGAALLLAIASGSGVVASYHAYKLLFVLTPLAAAIVAAAAAYLLATPGWPARALAAGALVLALALSGSFQIVPARPIQLLTPDTVAAARWLREANPSAAASAPLVGSPLGPLAYWVQIGLLGQRRDSADIARRDLTAPQPATESWLIDTKQPKIAILAGAEPIPTGAHLLRQFGTAAIIERDHPLDIAALNPLTIRYRTFWEDGRLKTAIELRHPLAGRLPQLEVGLYAGDTPVNRFVLAPDEQRTRTQYLGADMLPATLAGEGYVNVSAYPSFAAPAFQPTGALTLTLRLLIDGLSVDERALATFSRADDGRLDQLVAHSGELVYVRHTAAGTAMHSSALAFGDSLRLDGWGAPQRARAGAPLAIGLRWQAALPIGRALFPEVRLLDASGAPVASSLAAPQDGFYPTWLWRPGESVPEQRTLALPAGIAPGSYRLSVRVHDFASRQLVGSEQELGSVAIE